MASLEAGPITDRFEVRATADTHFGWLRTRLSVERTLMSYLRTAVSLIGFGFTIVQFFERLPGLPGSKPAYFPEAPYYLGLALISCGILVRLRHKLQKPSNDAVLKRWKDWWFAGNHRMCWGPVWFVTQSY